MRAASSYYEIAKEVFEIEAQAIAGLVELLDESFSQAVDYILTSNGRVIVSGMGKSGIVGKKLAATLASTGTQSFFIHPGEAYHGDLGMVAREDIFIVLSNSGETEELLRLLPFLKDNSNTLISITGDANSTIAGASDFHLNARVRREACPLELAPTASTTAALAMGDALAVALMIARDFMPENFARFHPGGALGRRLLQRVDDEMVDCNLPFVQREASFLDVLGAMTSGKLGLCIVGLGGAGVITDGDIRRALERFGNDIFNVKASDVMSVNPIAVEMGSKMSEALDVMTINGITSLLVKNNDLIVGVIQK